MFYGVYYYDISLYYPTQVKIAGYYESLDEAIARLNFVIPSFKKCYKNTVNNMYRVGWINGHNLGDMNETCSQPYNSIDVYSTS